MTKESILNAILPAFEKLIIGVIIVALIIITINLIVKKIKFYYK